MEILNKKIKKNSPAVMKHFYCLTQLFICFLFTQSVNFCEAQNATIYGKVTDKNNKGIEDVSISLLGFSNKPSYTNKQGQFEYEVPSNQNITIVFSNINYTQERIVLNLKPNERLELNKTIKPSGKSFLDSIVVEDKQNRTTTMTRLDPKIVSAIPSASGDFNTIIFSQLGVSNRNELSSAYSVRGGNFDENLVYVNGIEVYRPFLVRAGQQEGLSFVNSDMVSSILFSAGGFEAKYGDKMSSVLDIQYKTPRSFAGSVSGGLLGGNLHLEGASKDLRFTWITGVRYKTNRYILGGLDVDGDYRPSFTDWQTFLTYDITEKWELNFLGNYSKNRYQVIPENRQTSFGTINKALQLKVYFDGQEVDDFETYTGAISSIFRPTENINLKFIASSFRTFENESYDILGQYFIDELERDLGKPSFGNVVANLGVGSFLNHARNNLNATVYNIEHKGVSTRQKNQLLWGIKYQTENIVDRLSEWKYIDSAGYSLPQSPLSTIDLQDVIKTKIILSSSRIQGYFQSSWNKQTRDSSDLTITAGLRANRWSLNEQTVVSPRVTLAYKPNWKKDFLFRASSGFYYQPPFYREMRDLYGKINAQIKAQQSIHFVLGSDLNFKAWNRPFKFVTELYYKALNNLIPYEIDNVRIRYYAENSAKGYATGIDMKVNGEFIKGLESWASLSIMQTREDIKNDFYYVYYNRNGEKIIPGYTLDSKATDSIKYQPGYIPRPTDQRVNFSIFFQDYLPKFPDFKMHLSLFFATALPFGPPTFERYKDTLKMPPYRRVDIGFSYQIIKEGKRLPQHHLLHHLKSMWLSMEVLNLLDINNTVSYLWVKDVTNRQYAIPNYLTGRLLNVRLVTRF